MDPRYAHINSYYVFPNDAADIKAHPFFRGIQWNQLHLTQPPMIPRVKSWEDTRYFEDWKSSDHPEDLTENSENDGTDEKSDEKIGALPTEPSYSLPIQLLPGRALSDVDAITLANIGSQKTPAPRKRKQRKRARDKILRDRRTGKTAMEIRKQSVFLGYTYRRPKRPALALTPDRGRQRVGRDQLVDLYV